MSRRRFLPGMQFFESEPLFSSKLRDEPDWALVERITGKKCPETVSLRNLSRMTQAELKETLGLTDVQGKKLGAALVLGERLANEAIERGMVINNARDVFRIFQGQMKDAKKEGFYAVTVDQKNKVIDLHRISEGTLSMVPVHPREAFNPVLRDSASGVIFLHNHPSGNPDPSHDDHLLTERLAEAGKILGIRVIDHVVIGDGDFVSLRDQGVDLERGSGLSQAAENDGSRVLQSREDLPEEHLSTAVSRVRARDAEGRLEWKKAAGYYRMAIGNYPPDLVHGALAKRDIELLTASMKECLRMEATEAGRSQTAETGYAGGAKESTERSAGQETPTRSAPAVRRERGGMGF